VVLLEMLVLGQVERPLLLRHPTLNRTHIVFSFAGDLWIVSRDGGDAREPGIDHARFFKERIVTLARLQITVPGDRVTHVVVDHRPARRQATRPTLPVIQAPTRVRDLRSRARDRHQRTHRTGFGRVELIVATRDSIDAWLVKITPADVANVVSYSALVAGAPAANDSCPGRFTGANPLPWPPTTTAVPATVTCGSQRPGINIAPAIAPDGTVYTVSRAHLDQRVGYVVAVNPRILSEAGMPVDGVLFATCISSAVATLIMGLWANYPIALAPGMSLNAYFAYSIVIGRGVPWQTALGVVFLSGIIFLLLTLTKVREQIVNGIPDCLKHGTAGGIGLFIAFIGLRNSQVIVANPATFVGFGKISDPQVLLAAIGLIFIAILMARRIDTP